jgi:DNA relaxase NicK
VVGQLPRTRHGTEAVEAALDELDIRERIDEPDASMASAGEHDLRWARDRVGDDARFAAEADGSTPDEVMERIASAIGREYPLEPLEEEEPGD